MLRSIPRLRPLLLVAAAALAVFAVACTDDTEDPADPTETPAVVSPTESGGTGTASPAPGNETATPAEGAGTPAGEAGGTTLEGGGSCEDFARAMAEAFPDLPLVEDQGRYSLGDEDGEGCRTLVIGTAEDLPGFVEVSQTLRSILEDHGWTEDMMRAADGPGSTISVYERDGEMAVMAASMAPVDPSACPADQPISACFDSLEPSEIEVQGSIIVAGQ